MGGLRGIGYFIAIVILVAGILLFPIGLILIIPAIIMIWMLRKGGQVSSMQKELKSIKKIEQENQKLKLEQRRKDALSDRQDLEGKGKKCSSVNFSTLNPSCGNVSGGLFTQFDSIDCKA